MLYGDKLINMEVFTRKFNWLYFEKFCFYFLFAAQSLKIHFFYLEPLWT